MVRHLILIEVWKMSIRFKQYLDNYSKVIIKCGLNLKPGQRLLITSLYNIGVSIELASFIELLAKEAYRNGAKLVDVIWRDDQLQLLKCRQARAEFFEEYAKWRIEAIENIVEHGDALLLIYAEDVDLFVNEDQDLIFIYQNIMLNALKPVYEKISKSYSNYVVISAPISGWADKIFPEIPKTKRLEKFWDTLFHICRIKSENPIQAWDEHINKLNHKCEYLNQKQYKELIFSSSITQLKVGLPEKHKWTTSSEESRNGIKFISNIPTEEVYTLPHTKKVEGFVTSTKPLYLRGVIIENFKLIFSEGEVKEVYTEKGLNHLKKILSTDEGASRLGEIALVPHSSPISETNVQFYNILLDENASSHIALGYAHRSNLINGDSITDDEFSSLGGNISGIHIDFMIGSEDMNVFGILKDDSREPIMINGEWNLY